MIYYGINNYYLEWQVSDNASFTSISSSTTSAIISVSNASSISSSDVNSSFTMYTISNSQSIVHKHLRVIVHITDSFDVISKIYSPSFIIGNL